MGIAEIIIGRAFARPVGSTYRAEHRPHIRDRGFAGWGKAAPCEDVSRPRAQGCPPRRPRRDSEPAVAPWRLPYLQGMAPYLQSLWRRRWRLPLSREWKRPWETLVGNH